MNKYKSPYEAYPFLSDDGDDYRCDFEILTDRMASETGLLASLILEEELRNDLITVAELIYHLNASLRTFYSVKIEEEEFLLRKVGELEEKNRDRFTWFVLPVGSSRASLAHMLRADGKALVRLLYRQAEKEKLDRKLIDLANLLSGYFFMLALELNRLDGKEELDFISRNYK